MRHISLSGRDFEIREEFTDLQAARFIDKIYFGDESGCWIWTGYCDPNGYGFFNVGDTVKGAHRVSYSMFVEPVSNALDVHHKCENPSCVNPDHLLAVTPRDH